MSLKKLVSFALAACLLLSLSGCGGWKSNQELCGYEVFPGTDWGMTPGEALKGLGLTKDDVEAPAIDLSNSNLDDTTEWYHLKQTQEVFGHAADIFLGFQKSYAGCTPYVGLFHVRVDFTEPLDWVALAKQVNEELTYYGLPEAELRPESNYNWMSAKCSELEDETLRKRMLPVINQFAPDRQPSEEYVPADMSGRMIWGQVVLLSGNLPGDDEPPLGWVAQESRLIYNGTAAALLNNLDRPADSVKDEWKVP